MPSDSIGYARSFAQMRMRPWLQAHEKNAILDAEISSPEERE